MQHGKNIKKDKRKEKMKVSYYFFSGGTTGKPKVIPFTKTEWKKRAKYRSSAYKLIGLNSKDRIAILLPFGPWIAGPSVQSSLVELGCKYFPIGILNEENELLGFFDIIEQFSINVIITTPSFMEYFNWVYIKHKRKNKLVFKKIITSGEFLTDKLRNDIKKYYNADAISSYASSEFFIGIECPKNKNCFHYNSNSLDIKAEPDGLLKFTCKIAPEKKIIDYSLGDIGNIDKSKCSCGIDLPKVCLKGRANGIFSLSGAVNIFPFQVIEALSNLNFKTHACEIIIKNWQPGIDNILFVLYVDKNSKEIKNIDTDHIYDIISNLSIDFKDIVTHKHVKLNIDIKEAKNKTFKTILSIKDERNYER